MRVSGIASSGMENGLSQLFPLRLEEQVGPNFPGMGMCNGLGNQDAVSFAGVGQIAAVTIAITTVAPCGADGIGIDDVQIGDLFNGIMTVNEHDTVSKTPQNIQVEKNEANDELDVTDNTANEKIQCKDNSPDPTGSGNMGTLEDQCSGL